MKMYCINDVFTEFLNSACENSATAAIFRFYCIETWLEVYHSIEKKNAFHDFYFFQNLHWKTKLNCKIWYVFFLVLSLILTFQPQNKLKNIFPKPMVLENWILFKMMSFDLQQVLCFKSLRPFPFTCILSRKEKSSNFFSFCC